LFLLLVQLAFWPCSELLLLQCKQPQTILILTLLIFWRFLYRSFKGWQKNAVTSYLQEENIRIGKPSDFFWYVATVLHTNFWRGSCRFASAFELNSPLHTNRVHMEHQALKNTIFNVIPSAWFQCMHALNFQLLFCYLRFSLWSVAEQLRSAWGSDRVGK